MNIFIDVDYTLISANGSLRPHAHGLFRDLHSAGHTLWVWSGVGIRQAEIEKHGLGGMAAGYAVKPTFDYLQAIRRSPPPALPDLIIDDHPEIVRALGGFQVSPYFFVDERDAELKRASAALLAYAIDGICDDPSFIPPRLRP